MSYCIIPARGGSKRIPRKNIKSFLGKPLISYSINAALSSQSIEKIIVTTDDEEIAEVALANGADQIIWRNAQLSDDFATTADVIQDAIKQCALTDDSLVCCLYATAPLVDNKNIDLAQKIVASDRHIHYSFCATAFEFPVQRGFVVEAEGLEMLFPEFMQTRSQDLPEVYHDAGQFYWARARTWLNASPIFSNHSHPIIIPSYLVQDIDTQDDWQQAEFKYQYYIQR
ncbi:pseudaminic acid cytidylyltransferase [Glaciecola sp. 1036]|uniref:pseudaminic acid cytidylyltransferase n=1 Tax=Alteromonadaceae TaxID=72275 RepID=UPI003D009D36